jgi:hypothetical protein
MLFVPFLELDHGRSLVEKVQAHTTEQMLQVQNALVGKDTTHGISGLCALVQPFQGFLTIDLNGGRNGQGIVSADLLDEFTISRRTGIGYYDEIEGSLLTPVTL